GAFPVRRARAGAGQWSAGHGAVAAAHVARWRACAARSSALDQADEGLIEVFSPRSGDELGRRELSDDASFPQQDDFVAATGLVEYVARDKERRSFVRELPEQTPQVPAKQRIQTDCGFVQQQQPRPADKGSRK